MICILFYNITILVIVIDQLSKFLIRTYLNVGDTIVIWEGVLHFTHIQNSGIAFGWLQGFGRLFVPIAILITAFSIYLQRKGYLKGKVLKIGVAFYVGGAIGNAIDRILFNQVTDFIHFQLRQGILNLADYAISFGVLLILINVLILETINKRRAKNITDSP